MHSTPPRPGGPPVPGPRRGRATWGALVPLLLVAACGNGAAPPPSPAANVTPLSERFDPTVQGFAHLLPHLRPVQGLEGIRAADCGGCHRTIYEEWKSSTHAHALEDLQFQAELAKPDSPKWLCLNCHIPLRDQRAQLVEGLVEGDLFRPALRENDDFDPALRDEAITCAVCHLRRDARGRSLVVSTQDSGNAPHPVVADPGALRSVCLRCHDPQGEALTPNLFCWFTTASETVEAGHAPSDCSSCHMPRIARLLVEDRPDLAPREVPRHTFPGAGVPKTFEGFAQRGASGWRSGVDVDARRDGDALVVTLTNAHAGHAVPTADPERFLLVRLRALDATGAVRFEDTRRIGQTWEWSPARKVGDNRLAPGETRALRFDPPGGVPLVLDVLSVRLSRASAESMMRTEGLDEELLPGANALVRELPRHYPTAAYVARLRLDADQPQGTPADEPELARLSLEEREVPLEARGY